VVPEGNKAAYQRGYLDGMAKPCVDCADKGNQMKTTLEMAREAGIDAEKDTLCRYEGWLQPLKAFETLVRADERTRTWTQEHWTEYERSIAAVEREACAKVCDDLSPPCGYNLTEISFWDVTSLECAAAIRARGETK
jgi:hypothetical protein